MVTTDPEVVDEVVRVGVRLPPHRTRLHVDELHARQQVVRLAANQLEDEVAGAVADIFQNLKIALDLIESRARFMKRVVM